MDAGANPNVAMKFPHNLAGLTPLHYATASEIVSKATPLALALIAAGANVNARATYLGQSPLRQAIYVYNRPVIKAMLAKGAQTNVPDYDNRTDESVAMLMGLNLEALRPQKN